jgi:hypothetical protein
VARQQHRFVRCSGLHRTRIVAIASDRRNVTGPLSCADASSKMRSGRDVSQRAVAFTYLPHAKVYSPPHLSWGMDPPVRAASYWSETRNLALDRHAEEGCSHFCQAVSGSAVQLW